MATGFESNLSSAARRGATFGPTEHLPVRTTHTFVGLCLRCDTLAEVLTQRGGMKDTMTYMGQCPFCTASVQYDHRTGCHL